MKGNISMKEISELSGVSVATVSRVINQNGRFSKETEERVLRVIQEHQYAPNLLARGLRTNKTPVVGVIVPDITNEYFAQVVISLQKHLFDLNYSVIICNTGEVLEVEQRYLQMLKSQQVSGLIYISGADEVEEYTLPVPTIFIDRKPPKNSSEYVLIESDNEQGGYIATRRLLECGCKKIAILLYNPEISSHKSRYDGYCRALLEYGLPVDDALVFYARRVDIHEGGVSAVEILQRVPDVDGIFVTADLLAMGLMGMLDQRKIAVPDQIRVIGFDDISAASVGHFALTSVRQSVEKFGSLGAQTLVSMIEGNTPDCKQYILPVNLQCRSSG